MKIYLINIPFYEVEYIKFTQKWESIEDEYLGIEIVYTMLEDFGCDIFYSTSHNTEEIISEIFAFKPDTIMMAIMQSSASFAHNLVLELRAKGYTNDIFVGGWFAKMAWKKIFYHKWPVDYVCYVDAETAIASWLIKPNDFIPGIATYHNFNQQCKLNHCDIWLTNKWPKNYVTPHRIAGRNTYIIETSRGCSHSACTFCSQIGGNYSKNKWEPVPLEIIKREIITLHNQYGASNFATADDDLLGPITRANYRARELHDLIKSLPFKINFTASISVKAATNPDILDWLIGAGLTQLCLGFESVDREQLRRYNKQQTVEDNFIAAYEVTKRNIRILPGLITFDPLATVTTVKSNLEFLWNNLHHYDIDKFTKRLHILTETPLVKKFKKIGLLTGDYLGYDYRFLYPETETIYNNFKEYTKMVKPLQLKARQIGIVDKDFFYKQHLKVAKIILDRSPWLEVAHQEIYTMKKLLEDKKIEKVEYRLGSDCQM